MRNSIGGSDAISGSRASFLVLPRLIRPDKLEIFKAAFIALKSLPWFDQRDGSQSEVWPSPHEASRVIEKFKSLPSCSQTSHMVNQSGFLRQNLSRLSNNLDKETKKVQSLRTELLLVENMNKDAVDVTDSHDLQHMLRMLERKIRLVDRRIEELEPSSSAFSSVGKEAGNSSHVGKGKQPM